MGREEVLSYLLERADSWVSGEEIASELDVTRAAIWKQVQSLRASGFDIKSSTNRGYRLEAPPDLLDPGLIRRGLKAHAIGKNIHCHGSVDSTNAIAKELARTCEDGTVVLADMQRQGKGRIGRSWSSPVGGVWMSVVLKPKIAPAHAGRINIIASLAVASAISKLYGLDAKIKWPNDITVEDRKLGGILTEIGAEMDQIEYAVVGMGINANLDVRQFPPEWNATSLQHMLGREVSRVELIQQLLFEIERYYKEIHSSYQEIHSEWCNRSSTLGRFVRIKSHSEEFEGTAISLDQDGALILRLPEGEIRRVLVGDCIHLRVADDRHPM